MTNCPKVSVDARFLSPMMSLASGLMLVCIRALPMPKSEKATSMTANELPKRGMNSDTTVTMTLTTTFTYDGAGTIRVDMLIEGDAVDLAGVTPQYVQIPEIWSRTTLSTLGQPLYIDLEDGMAYKYVSGEYISVNSCVWLGAQLPTLEPGVTNVSYSGHITQLQIIPRWWTI